MSGGLDSAAWGKEPYDIVLVELNSPVNMANVALLPAGRATAGQSVTLAGWGATSSSGGGSRILRKVDLKVEGSCVATNKICAVGVGAAGSGDSGGGLYRRSGSRYDFVGITSTSDRSGWTSFTEVYAYLSWIKSISGITRATQLGGTDTGTCVDKSGFVDAQGYRCADWVGYNCSRAAEDYGYSGAQETNLLANCRKTCGQCGS